MDKKQKCLETVERVKKALKQKVRESWSPSEKKAIQERGELEADFYQVWYKLCKLETMERWIEKHGFLTGSQTRILREYIGENQWKKLKEF